jgi:hypothetical protein
MPGDPKQEDEAMTLRGVLNMLMAVAAELPLGLDSRVEFGVCDGENLQRIDQVDVDIYTNIQTASGEEAGEPFVILRAQSHPGQTAGRPLRGVASNADDELRKLTGDNSG